MITIFLFFLIHFIFFLLTVLFSWFANIVLGPIPGTVLFSWLTSPVVLHRHRCTAANPGISAHAQSCLHHRCILFNHVSETFPLLHFVSSTNSHLLRPPKSLSLHSCPALFYCLSFFSFLWPLLFLSQEGVKGKTGGTWCIRHWHTAIKASLPLPGRCKIDHCLAEGNGHRGWISARSLAEYLLSETRLLIQYLNIFFIFVDYFRCFC